ncbi:piggyBac transposable element-derived protein 2-like [Palaemon carinicauda]|uniref:piggyBac transposable element-derived protein 2-like n=1 Tax=Palaemon carinicauda TaxID=392227 RepID=UPI0035B696B1
MDEDSAGEDEGGLIDNLPGKQLNAPAEAVFLDGRRTTEDDGDSEEYRSSSHSSGYKNPKWRRGNLLSSVDCIFPEPNYVKYRDFSPMELFELFFDEEVWSMIVNQTIVYSKSKRETSFTVTKEELKVFLGILLSSGIVPVSSRRLFWKNSPLTRNEAVYNAMRRSRFEKIMQFVHFADNSALDKTDKYEKVCPLVKLISNRFISRFQPGKFLSHDETMIEYFGKHGYKQCIRGKPIRFGYKAWCLHTDDGYLVSFDLYQGCTYEGNVKKEKTFGKCAATVLKNIDSLQEDRRHFP